MNLVCGFVGSDGQYVAPLIKTANYHAETADTYLYAFSYSTQSESGAQSSEDVQVGDFGLIGTLTHTVTSTGGHIVKLSHRHTVTSTLLSHRHTACPHTVTSSH